MTPDKTTARPDAFRRSTAALVDEFRESRPLRTGSLIVTVFGDAIAPRGGSVWLGSLIAALAPFGINQRLVRTSVFRLVREGWLQAEQVGRRSYYSLSPGGRARFREASRRIYAEPRREWPGTWCLALLSGVDAAHRDGVRKELGWLGFAPFSSSVLAHPMPDTGELEERLAAVDGGTDVLLMQASTLGDGDTVLRRLIGEAWSLATLDERYLDFVRRFRPVYQAARRRRSLLPEAAFHVRTLLIHEYRKILLRDPFLPDRLLPDDWNGLAAYQLCRNLYEQVSAATETYLDAALETADGPLPPAGPEFARRFGGALRQTVNAA